VVIDTNVIVAALRSRRGASYRLVSEIDSGRFEVCVSVPLILEYEAVLVRQSRALGLNRSDIGDFLDYFCAVARRQDIFYLWRPRLRDASDDMVLEVAVAGGCSHLVTFNQRDFEPGEHLGVRAVTPQGFLRTIGVIE
jgi:putative PIN family toxin of toxin-antitoxin system